MSHAVATFGRFNGPTEKGHGKLIAAVQQHAEDVGAKHYIFPSHTQDPKKNPLSHGEKVKFMRRLFPTANIVSSKGIRNVIDAMKHLESKGHKEVTMVVGSDRVGEFKSLLNKYRTKEFPRIKKVYVKSAGQRDPDAEGEEGESASKHRALVSAGKRDEFIKKYSDTKLGAEIHDALKKGMQMESTNPIGIFLLGGPGSGKDYVLNNIFSRFDLVEVQIDQVLNGKAAELIESNQNIVINGAADAEKIELVKNILEGYTFDTVYVSVSNKVSRARNEERQDPLLENKRLEKWYRAEKLAEALDCFVFNNSINLNESSQMEQIMFGGQIEGLLERLVSLGLVLSEKKAVPKDKASGLPKKYVAGLSASTAKARAAHWKEKAKLSDSDPRAYEPAPGDATAKTKPSKYTLKVRKMMDEAELKKIRRVPRSGNITAVMDKRKETGRVSEEIIDEGAADKSLSAKAEKSGISVSTLRKVYRRGVAAWNSGHRPGTTPSQWGHARVNSYISKGKGTYHGADKDLRENVDDMFENELLQCCPDMDEAVDVTPTLDTANKKKKSQIVPPRSRDAALDGMPVVTTGAYAREETELDEVSSKPPSKAKQFKNFLRTPRQIPGPPGGHPVPAGYERVHDVLSGGTVLRKLKESSVPLGHIKIWNPIVGDYVLKNAADELALNEAVEYHIANKIPFTENVFRPGSDMFFKMLNEAKRLYKEGEYTPSDEWEKDMLESNIGEIAKYEGREVILDYPFQEELEEEVMQLDEVFDAVYPHQYHGTVGPSDTGDHVYSFYVPEKGTSNHHTYSVSITNGPGKPGSKTGNLSFDYNGRQPKNFSPITGDDVEYLRMHTAGDVGITGKGGGKASSVISTVKAIAQKHAIKHGLSSIEFSGNMYEPSRIKLYDRIARRFGGKRLSRSGTTSSHVYSVPIKEEDETGGKGVGKPWREGGGGAVYVRVGDSIRKIRFSQSGMKKKYMDPAATRSFVARHHCLTNKDKTSASYWACRYPRFFSNSGKTWW